MRKVFTFAALQVAVMCVLAGLFMVVSGLSSWVGPIFAGFVFMMLALWNIYLQEEHETP